MLQIVCCMVFLRNVGYVLINNCNFYSECTINSHVDNKIKLIYSITVHDYVDSCSPNPRLNGGICTVEIATHVNVDLDIMETNVNI